MPSGLTDLSQILAILEPTLREGEFVYTELPRDDAARMLAQAEATIMEDEGLTVVLRRADADAAGLTYDFVASWITLTVSSSLHAVGLTAAFSTALGEAGISCNVLAGRYHDHLLVPARARVAALQVLRHLSS